MKNAIFFDKYTFWYLLIRHKSKIYTEIWRPNILDMMSNKKIIYSIRSAYHDSESDLLNV